jgi:phosphoglycerol transferase MdoB-like AlkP superfamily enzyme
MSLICATSSILPSSIYQIILQVLYLESDGGPIYAETNLDRFIVEPFNTASAFLFIIISLYWYFKLRGRFGKYHYLSFSLILLSVGAVGGVIYHAFRAAPIWMWLDWLAILILCMSTGVYFLWRYFNSKTLAFLIVSALLVAQIIIFEFSPIGYATSINYIINASIVVVPTFLVLRRFRFLHVQYVLGAIVAFVLAITSRIADRWHLEWFEGIGTHFLWHIFGAIAGHLMFIFLYKITPVFPDAKTQKKALSNESAF